MGERIARLVRAADPVIRANELRVLADQIKSADQESLTVELIVAVIEQRASELEALS